MNNLLKSKLLRSAGIYTIANGINSAIPFFLLPILTRYLTPAEYGMVAMFQVLIGLVMPFAGLNIQGAISVKYFDKENINFPQYIANCLLLLLVSTGIVSLAFWIFKSLISTLSSIPETWLWAVIVICFGQYLNSIILVLWQLKIKPLNYGLFQICQTVLNMSVTIWLVVDVQLGWQGSIIGQLLAVLFFSSVSFIILYKNDWLRFRYNNSYILEVLKFGGPLIPHTLGSFIMAMTDRIFIANMVGIADAGIYTVGYQVGQAIALLENSFNQAWVPWLFNQLKLDNWGIKHKIVKFTYIYNIIILVFAVLLALVAPWFLKFLVGKEFLGSNSYVLWIALGYAFNGMYKMVCNYIFYVQKTYLLAWVTFFTAIVNVILNYILISLNGPVGAAQATMVALFISFILTWVLSNRVYKMPWLSFSFHQKKQRGG